MWKVQEVFDEINKVFDNRIDVKISELEVEITKRTNATNPKTLYRIVELFKRMGYAKSSNPDVLTLLTTKAVGEQARIDKDKEVKLAEKRREELTTIFKTFTKLESKHKDKIVKTEEIIAALKSEMREEPIIRLLEILNNDGFITEVEPGVWLKN